MVEAPGIEPGSEDLPPIAPTRVFRVCFLAPKAPAERTFKSQPIIVLVSSSNRQRAKDQPDVYDALSNPIGRDQKGVAAYAAKAYSYELALMFLRLFFGRTAPRRATTGFNCPRRNLSPPLIIV